MNLKTNSVAPSCAEARVNVRAGAKGASCDVVNMRETNKALVAVGMPRELLSLPSVKAVRYAQINRNNEFLPYENQKL